jgi:hypothetical protein
MHAKLRPGGSDSYALMGSSHTLAVAPPGCDGHFLPGSAADEFRLPRASSWTFFMSVCSGLQQISHRSRLSSRMSCLPSLAPLTLTCAHPRSLSASRKQQSQTKVVFVPMIGIKTANVRLRKKNPPGVTGGLLSGPLARALPPEPSCVSGAVPATEISSAYPQN